ncbi:uncharacterized protein TRIADDRAFT_59079 [Trichoplax adhaerens]|uniref:NB-ARC domain-containing protein n=1 Tax=Trichoplax adhaerens TaxID=10228 RepID=B3S4G8_TRIAD|nr:hypothetical protein TRIADDRAFT_59079 [Trichoplax adhaerens]EDV22461.1 hypothetical protein TRIADDRAFT_59079 [Trichoplax adhaerens]|eukprot:XP_002115005.1 hypothetical protein TRIADDRAFT_59079 [Trichoplax adhaerens]
MARQIGMVFLRPSRLRIGFLLLKPNILFSQEIRLVNTSTNGQSMISKYMDRARNVFNEPFVKISLMALAAVMSATALYEYLYHGPAKKKNKLGIQILPASPNHFCIERNEYISHLESECGSLLRSLFFKDIKTIFLTGLTASGKSQIARFYAEKYSKKFRFPVIKPPVIATLSGNSIEDYLSSIRSLAIELGSTPSEWSRESDNGILFSNLPVPRQIEILVEEVSQKLKMAGRWLLIIDDLKSDCGIKQAWWPQPDQDNIWGKGCVLITCEEALTPKVIEQTYKASRILNVDKKLTESEALSLLHQMNEDKVSANAATLVNELLYSPLAISLAASYIKSKNENTAQDSIYDCSNFIEEFKAIKSDILRHWNSDRLENNASFTDKIVASMCLQQYGKADSQMHSTFDILGALEPRRPIPMAMVETFIRDNEVLNFRLKSRTTKLDTTNSDLKSLEVTPPGEQISSIENIDNSENEDSDDSGVIRTFITKGKEIYRTYFSNPSSNNGDKNPKEIQDDSSPIYRCPLLSCNLNGDIKTVSIHPVIHSVMQKWYFLMTIPIMEKLYVSEQRVESKSSWFGQIKKFDETACLEGYRGRLCDQFNLKLEPSNYDELRNVTDQTNLIHKLVTASNMLHTPYSKAQQYSLLRRIGKSAITVTKNRRSEIVYRKSCKLLLPHFAYLMRHLQVVDLKNFSELLDIVAMIHSDVLSEDLRSVEMFKNSLLIKRKIHGDKHYETAHTLTLLGIVLNSLNRLDDSKTTLEEALSIYNSLPTKKMPDPQHVRNLATTLSTLGVVCSNLGEHKRSRDLLERALSLMQSIQPQNALGLANDEIFNHAADVATMLTDIGHSYLLNGETSYGHRLLQFALNIHQNIHGEEHYEVVRTLTVLSIAQMIQGFHEDSRKSRDRAGAIRGSLNANVLV